MQLLVKSTSNRIEEYTNFNTTSELKVCGPPSELESQLMLVEDFCGFHEETAGIIP
jgi:hypothetical protein